VQNSFCGYRVSDEIDTKPLQLGPNVDPLQSIKLQLEVVAAEKSRVAEREDSKLQVSGGAEAPRRNPVWADER